MKSSAIYGLMAEFDDANSLVSATEQAHHAGYRRMDAYSPFPIEELHEALGSRHTRLPLIVLVGGLLGCIGGYALQYWSSVFAYPLNIGGKPLHSWPAFIPVTFECTILGASLFAVSIVVNIGMWLERFVIVVTSLHRDFLPSSWGNYAPTFWDLSTYVGTIGLFVSLLFLFLRFLPMISIAEMRAILPAAKVDEGVGM